MPRKRFPQSWGSQLTDLTVMQLSNWRWSWRAMVVTGIASPLLATALLGTLGRASGALALGHILTGALVMGLLFENQNKVAANFSFMKEAGTLTYFRSMPVRPHLVVVATVAAFFLLSLPALVCTLVFGVWLLDIPLHVSPLVLVAVPACAVSLAGIGAAIGVLAKSPEEAGSIALLFSLALLCLGPVLVPRELLPEVLQRISVASPATYAGSALRQTLLGPVDAGLFLRDVGVLAGTALVTLPICARQMRQDS